MTPQEIGALVLSESFDMPEAVKLVTPQAVHGAIVSYEAAQRPMSIAEPDFASPSKRSDRITEISRALQTIGAKVSPTMSGEQATMWRDAILVSLSGWPVNAVRYAASTAMREPFKFLSDVDPRLHELATEATGRAKEALFRLKRMRIEIDRALNPPQPQIAAEPMVWTEATIAEANAAFARVGVRTRYRLKDGTCETYRADPAIENEGLQPSETMVIRGSEGNPED